MMKLMVDTQILIWSLLDESLSDGIRELLSDPDNDILIPQLCLYEIAIKQKIGKLPELTWPTYTIVHQLVQDGFELLPLKTNHIAAYEQVPLLPNHRDPFDRLLIATALAEQVPIISADEKFSLYVPLIDLIAP